MRMVTVETGEVRVHLSLIIDDTAWPDLLLVCLDAMKGLGYQLPPSHGLLEAIDEALGREDPYPHLKK